MSSTIAAPVNWVEAVGRLHFPSKAHGQCQYCFMNESLQGLTGEQVPLFCPVRQRWSENFRFKGYQMEGLTAVGRATVAMLDLNHLRRQRIRQAEQAFGLYPQTR